MARHRTLPFPDLTLPILLVLLCGLWSGRASAQTVPIRFAPLPMENREAIILQFRPMVEYLGETLGRPVVFDFSDDYTTILDKFLRNKIDLAYLGPLPYIELRSKTVHAEPLVLFREASGHPKYTCAIAALADTPIQLSGLKNHRIALTQPLSTCGYLAVNGLLREHGSSLADNRHHYLDKHDAVALAVIRGEFDLGGLKTAIARRYTHLGLTIVAETQPFPGFGLIGHRSTLTNETMEAIRAALIRLDPAGADQKRLSLWGNEIRHGAIPASDSDYDTIRRYKRTLEIPMPTGNK